MQITNRDTARGLLADIQEIKALTVKLQKFHKGDTVRIATELPEYMSHFPGAGSCATVLYSYWDKYGHQGSDAGPEYGLQVRGYGQVAWYPEAVLLLVRSARTTVRKKLVAMLPANVPGCTAEELADEILRMFDVQLKR